MAELNNENLKENLTEPEQLAAGGRMKKQPTGPDTANDAEQNKKSGDSKLKKAGMAAAGVAAGAALAPVTLGASVPAGAAAGAAESAGAGAAGGAGATSTSALSSALKRGQKAGKNLSSTSEKKDKQQPDESSDSSNSQSAGGYKPSIWYFALMLAVSIDVLIIGTADAGAFVGINEIVDTIISPTLFLILRTQGSPNSLKKKATRWIINYIIKLIPFLDLLPSNTVNVLLEWRDAKNYYESIQAQIASAE
jgi:hypothetical protein